IRKNPLLNIEIRAGTHSKRFVLNTRVQASYETAMSLIIKNENRWVRTYLDYYLECMAVEHVYLYDNNTEDLNGLMNTLAPYINSGKLTYIPWRYRWRNKQPYKQIGQPPQEVQCLNKYGSTKWIGFFDIDEFLRIPGQTIPEFLHRYDAAKVGGISFGLRWFMYQGDMEFNELDNPLLECLYSRRSGLGRKRQKLFVSPQNVRFMRFHWIEEGQQEVQIDDEDIFFHHYYLTEDRYIEGKQENGLVYDDYMLRFSAQLLDHQSRRSAITTKARPRDVPAWIEHIDDSFKQAEYGWSRLSHTLLSLEGMSGTFTRHFYNNLCNLDACHYLEIGCWKGASLSAAMFGNSIQVTAIDNWSEFRWPDREDPRDVFFENVEHYKGECDLNILEQDCFEVERESLGKIDIYLFDGNHSAESQYRAIEYYYPALSDLAVVIIDDWNFPDVRKGTKKALEALNIKVEYSKEIILPQDEVANMPRHKGKYGWWNGIFVMLINKQSCDVK
ncbi:MAG: glycosyltransferase family 92 protein, partial [Gammaproteobacteria bacterium]|nr:glycosyltransferase family 92 protein [Gammaproteobacteria bacterium]